MKQVRQQSAQAQSNGGELNENNVRLVPVNAEVVGELRADGESGIPAQWRNVKPSLRLGAGDVVQVSIFEAPPSVLLSSSAKFGWCGSVDWQRSRFFEFAGSNGG